MSSAQRIADWIIDLQRKTRECPKVWGVYVRFEGEQSLEAVYDSKEAAELHRDWYNRKPRYAGKASVGGLPLKTLEIAGTGSV